MDSRVIPSLDLQHYIDLCYEFARFSTCAKARYGSVIVMASENMPYGLQHVDEGDEQIVGIGCNRSPNPACEDCATLCAGKLRLGVKSGTRVELCYAVHAEQWALLKAGPLAEGATLFNAGFDSNWEKTLRKDPTLPPGTRTQVSTAPSVPASCGRLVSSGLSATRSGAFRLSTASKMSGHRLTPWLTRYEAGEGNPERPNARSAHT